MIQAPTRRPAAASSRAAATARAAVNGPAVEPLLRIGELSRRTGRTVRTLRLYEELGLLRPAERSAGGFRLYKSDAEARVRWIQWFQTMGFSLPRIAEVLRMGSSAGRGPEANARLRAIFEEKLADTRRALAEHRALEAELVRGLRWLGTCTTCDPASPHVRCTCAEGEPDAEPLLLAAMGPAPCADRSEERSHG